METKLPVILQSFELGEPAGHGALTVFPLLGGPDAPPEYLTLEEALAGSLVEVREISTGGSVPELRVINRAKLPVLLVDGEELIGAKQNRVVNATILLKPDSETLIPVSCTEHGRWSYTSEKFTSSGSVMANKIRASKTRSVQHSLKTQGAYMSDQGQVWDEIAELSSKTGVQSPTGAMQAVYEQHRDRLEDYLSIPAGDGQRGLLAAINGRPAGLDLFSRPSAYKRLHRKLLTSYAMEAMTAKGPGGETKIASLDMARTFLAAIEKCSEKPYPSVGLGIDYRYENGSVCGSALEYEAAIIHAVFFALDETAAEPHSGMSSLSRRRRFWS